MQNKVKIYNISLVIQIMWNLQPQISQQARKVSSLPLINFDVVMIALFGLILIKVGMDKLLIKKMNLGPPRYDRQFSTLQYSPFYHLAIVILILSDLNWNMFDLVIWTYSYVGMGIIRQSLLNVKLQKQTLLSGYSFDLRVMSVLQNSKVIGAVLFLISGTLFIMIETAFSSISMRITNLLVFPILMLITDSVFLFLSSAASQKDILCYFNQNINQIQPTYKLELVQKIVGSSIKVWHFYNLLRIFLRALLDKMDILEYMWIFSILNAGFSAIQLLVNSFNKFRSYNKLMKKFDRLFLRSTSAPDQICTICLCELLNCRQLASCGHLFHYRCLFQWMQTKMECPVCRIQIQFT